ncbi:S46 family peptidase [soil metagenome]
MIRTALTCGLLGVLVMTAHSDEGMWLLNDPPRKTLAGKYQFDLTDAWLKRAMHGNVRFNNGGSGGFVSKNGLIVTNHHIAADALQKLSTPQRDLLRDGFKASKRSEELTCPDLELNVLQGIVDVTDQVNAAVKPEMKPAEAAAARRAIISTIEKESLDVTKLRSDVVTLYQGGLYHLYRYKKYTDVRLVFAPEHSIAFFGGDTDNFEYPRYNLDVSFFRAYDDGKPVNSEHYFRWSETGPKENDLVFVTGHPGTTNRLETHAKLIHRRDVTLPYTLARLRMMEAALEQYSARGPEQHRQAATNIHSIANARKALSGQYQGLLDPKILAAKKLSDEVIAGELIGKIGAPWSIISGIQDTFGQFEIYYNFLERGDALSSDLFGIARHLVRMSAELSKPSSERLREYRDSNLESLKFSLFSPAPIYAPLERAKMMASMTFLAENFGGGNSIVKEILAERPPAVRAEELVQSKLYDVAVRKSLFDGGAKAIADSKDPMIQLAILIDEKARAVRKKYEDEVEEPERKAFGEIAKLRFAKFGRTVAPDATFTLRLAFGTVKGYDVDGETLPFATNYAGAFAKAESFGHKEPNALPKSWTDRKDKLDLKTPFNFASTADTIGGNSGSPVLNRDGELVGINFDRNRHGLVRNFVYTDVQARHIAVHSAAVLEALSKIYDAPELVKELLAK